MKLNGIDFGYVMNASGARGFVGEGYWYHQLLRPLGLRYTGSTFVSKTVTLHSNAGRMPLKTDGLTPQEWYPRCIRLLPGACSVVNSVSLSNFGAKFYLDLERWQKWPEPFLISFMSIADTKSERLSELAQFVNLLCSYLEQFQASFGLEINFSCPNVGLHAEEVISEIHQALDIAGRLLLPIVIKLNAITPVSLVKDIMDHRYCSALCMSNSLPWKYLRLCGLDPQRIFGSDTSPIAHIDPNGGGLSGRYLLPIVCDWIAKARQLGIRKPIIGCGGIMSRQDAKRMFDAGADAIQLGSISLERFWRVAGVIRSANRYGAAKERERASK